MVLMVLVSVTVGVLVVLAMFLIVLQCWRFRGKLRKLRRKIEGSGSGDRDSQSDSDYSSYASQEDQSTVFSIRTQGDTFPTGPSHLRQGDNTVPTSLGHRRQGEDMFPTSLSYLRHTQDNYTVHKHPSTPRYINQPRTEHLDLDTLPAPPTLPNIPPVTKYEFPSFLRELQTRRVPPPPPVRRDQPAPSHFLQPQDVSLAVRGKLASLV